jgi:hypothetical protein
MAIKKTIKVEEILKWANDQLKRTDETATQEFKSGICTMLERVLFNTGNYAGFQHNYWNEKGWKLWCEAGQPEEWPEKKKYIGPEYDRCYS